MIIIFVHVVTSELPMMEHNKHSPIMHHAQICDLFKLLWLSNNSRIIRLVHWLIQQKMIYDRKSFDNHERDKWQICIDRDMPRSMTAIPIQSVFEHETRYWGLHFTLYYFGLRNALLLVEGKIHSSCDHTKGEKTEESYPNSKRLPQMSWPRKPIWYLTGILWKSPII